MLIQKGNFVVSWQQYLSQCTQQGETRNTQTRIYFKIIVFNDDIKVRQGNADTQEHREQRVDQNDMELNRQDLNTPDN